MQLPSDPTHILYAGLGVIAFWAAVYAIAYALTADKATNARPPRHHGPRGGAGRLRQVASLLVVRPPPATRPRAVLRLWSWACADCFCRADAGRRGRRPAGGELTC